jgi:hypothetical protein
VNENKFPGELFGLLARIFGIPLGTLKSRLFAAREELRELWNARKKTHLTAMHGWRWPAFLTGRTLIPRSVAAAAALVIVGLSIGFAVFIVHAQGEGPWVQLSFTVNPVRVDGVRGMTGIVQSAGMARGAWVIRGTTEAVAFTLRTVDIREAAAHIEVAVRGFSAPIDVRTAQELVKQLPHIFAAGDYWRRSATPHLDPARCRLPAICARRR